MGAVRPRRIGIIGNMGAANPRGPRKSRFALRVPWDWRARRSRRAAKNTFLSAKGREGTRRTPFVCPRWGQELKVVEKCILGSSWNQIE